MDNNKQLMYSKLEKIRGSKLLVYVTGDRPGWETQIGNDATDYFVEQLDTIGVVPKITLLLYTEGGSTLAGWNIVNLIRQFCDEFEIIIPSKARSTGTLMCLGANKLIMTKQATLGPIDPSINTPLNPEINGLAQGARLPVSVEAIKGFLELAKHELAIKDDEALASIFNVLAEKVHPLVLGEVYRAISQIRMLAEKLIRNQVTDSDKIKKIISFLCSESGSHDYTINRREAANELGLSVEKPDDELYSLIRDIFNILRNELQLRIPYDPEAFLGQTNNKAYSFRRVILESVNGGTDAFVSEGILSRISIPATNNSTAQMAISDQRQFEGWKHYD